MRNFDFAFRQQIDKKTNGPKIWIYKDKATGDGKGEATITYEDEEAAQAAINWYHGKKNSILFLN